MQVGCCHSKNSSVKMQAEERCQYFKPRELLSLLCQESPKYVPRQSAADQGRPFRLRVEAPRHKLSSAFHPSKQIACGRCGTPNRRCRSWNRSTDLRLHTKRFRPRRLSKKFQKPWLFLP